MDSISAEGKVILITGAFGLIGKTIALSFLRQGAQVVLADRNADVRADVLRAISEFNADNYLIADLDITQDNECHQSIEQTTEKFGRIDVLINNAALDAKFDASHAGRINHSAFENYPIQLLEASMHINITGTIRITQHICRQMLRQGHGNIINVASTYSLVAPNQRLYDFGDGRLQYKPVDYIVTKSFIPNFTRYLATFYAKQNIRCNAIAPHGIFNDHAEDFIKNFSQLSPLGRMADKEEITGPFTFLASDASSYMTGSVLVVDGGWTAW